MHQVIYISDNINISGDVSLARFDVCYKYCGCYVKGVDKFVMFQLSVISSKVSIKFSTVLCLRVTLYCSILHTFIHAKRKAS